MARNIVDESTLTVSNTSIGLSSADPTLEATTGAHQAVITVLTAPVCYHQDGGDATTSDPILQPGDILNVLGDNMRQVLTNVRFIRLTSTDASLAIRWYDREPFTVEQVTRQGVSIVDNVGISIEKAEDAAHTSGDKGIPVLAVRTDKKGSRASDGDYEFPQLDKYGGVRFADWDVGPIELRADCTGWARWENKSLNRKDVIGTEPNRQFRQGPWAVHLNGGNQNWAAGWEDWASIWIPVNEMKLTDLTEIMFTHYKDLAGTADVGAQAPNIAIRIHDPANHDARAEITIPPSTSTITEGWHETIMTSATSAFHFGDNLGSPDICTGEGPVNPYTIAQYQADAVFSTWTVYQIHVDYGYWGLQRSTGDAWIGSMQINDIPVKMEPVDKIHLGTRDCFNLDSWVFGEPSLKAVMNSDAVWVRGDPAMTGGGHLKGSTGWLANLYGGVQTNDDWAAINIPVNELPVSCFNSARWSYLMTAAESAGINMVIWLHDPFDFDKRVEVTQRADITGLTRTQGWHAHRFDPDATQMYYYGEGEANESICTTQGTDYTWKEYQGDECFNTWTIYRITFEYGWWASGTFDDAYVADISLNNQKIELKPDSGGTGRIGHRFYTTSSATFAGSLAPSTPFRLLSVAIHTVGVLATGENFLVWVDATRGSAYDVNLITEDLFVGSRTDYFAAFGEGYDFRADDVIDFSNANGGTDTIGVTIAYQTVFA